MELHIIHAENFKVDGGATFGVVPKSIWSKLYPADENNMITASNRLLFIVSVGRKILIDTGIGDKQDEKYRSHFYISGNNVENALIEKGFSPDEISDVIFTHLHWDHCGGAVKYNEDKSKLIPVFKNATYYCSKTQWDCAINPNPREKAAYHRENFMLLFEQGRLELIHDEIELFPGIFLKIVNGHTSGQIIPEILYNNRKLIYMADFIPSTTHVPLAYLAAYDIQPLIALKEKEEFLTKAIAENYVLFFEHDYINECCTVHLTEKGVKVKETFPLKSLN
jgi:glyoxylase-like metal-dependent hydrolase (beta-lactamase superfamily II)